MKHKSLPIYLLVMSAVLGGAFRAQAQATRDFSDGPDRDYVLSVGKIFRIIGTNLAHSYVGFNVKPVGSTGNWQLGTDSYRNGGSMLLGGVSGSLSFLTMPINNAANVQTLTDSQLNAYSRMQINPSGQVNIGVQVPVGSQSDYKLAIDGKLVAKSVYVTNPASWADFVFDSSYKPMTLMTLENYIQKNKHLPYMPSANEVQTDGYNMTEMDAKLLRTVEELALQVIELNKEIIELKQAKIQKQDK